MFYIIILYSDMVWFNRLSVYQLLNKFLEFHKCKFESVILRIIAYKFSYNCNPNQRVHRITATEACGRLDLYML